MIGGEKPKKESGEVVIESCLTKKSRMTIYMDYKTRHIRTHDGQ